ncbi:hypothetical protein LTR78_000378 [Recurvomyces mirabilis]|uniref:F-box domain-containing protein n=1 Tax=Recurvomyces mirabilis TaxID=574656 RepID=A0AAE1C6I5_9PEZI|nr:hypothetical protein LTR78_000378 [Recurvomyces mirabilis]KAK5162033.1 hypothetical protein LTS14_000379 [Recurvomyces mirabilis]
MPKRSVPDGIDQYDMPGLMADTSPFRWLASTTFGASMAGDKSTMTLSGLPLELRAGVLEYVELKTIFAADATCKPLHEAVEFHAPYILAHERAKTMAGIRETYGKLVTYDKNTSIVKAIQDFAKHRPCSQRPFRGRHNHLKQFASQYVGNTLEILDPAQSFAQTYERCTKVEIVAQSLLETCRPKAFDWCVNHIQARLQSLLLCCPSYPIMTMGTDFNELYGNFTASKSFLGVPMSRSRPVLEPARFLLTPTRDNHEEYPSDGQYMPRAEGDQPWYCTVDELARALDMPLPRLHRDNFSYCVYTDKAYKAAQALVEGEGVSWRQILMVVTELHIY